MVVVVYPVVSPLKLSLSSCAMSSRFQREVIVSLSLIAFPCSSTTWSSSYWVVHKFKSRVTIFELSLLACNSLPALPCFPQKRHRS